MTEPTIKTAQAVCANCGISGPELYALVEWRIGGVAEFGADPVCCETTVGR